MRLQRLTKENAECIKGKEIYCVGSTESYIRELCDIYHVRGNIVCVVDRNVRNRTGIYVDGVEIPVREAACFAGEELSGKALIITDDDYKENFKWFARSCVQNSRI